MAELCQYSNSDCCRWENGCLSMVKLFIAPSPGELRMIPSTNMCGKCNKIHKHKILGNCAPTPPLKERFSPSSWQCQLWLRGGVDRNFFWTYTSSIDLLSMYVLFSRLRSQGNLPICLRRPRLAHKSSSKFFSSAKRGLRIFLYFRWQSERWSLLPEAETRSEGLWESLAWAMRTYARNKTKEFTWPTSENQSIQAKELCS